MNTKFYSLLATLTLAGASWAAVNTTTSLRPAQSPFRVSSTPDAFASLKAPLKTANADLTPNILISEDFHNFEEGTNDTPDDV